MKLLKHNEFSELIINKDISLFFSYEDCIGILQHTILYITSGIHSKTTSKHINMIKTECKDKVYSEVCVTPHQFELMVSQWKVKH